MELHKLLQRQIRKFLPPDTINHTECSSFLKAISDSYYAYERDQELSNHAFALSEQEFHKLNGTLKKEVETRNISLEKLKEIVYTNNPSYTPSSNDDLISITEFVKNISEKQTLLEIESNKNIKRITSLIGNLNSGVLFENEDRGILFTNNIFCRMFGIPVAPEMLTGVDCSESAEQSKVLFANPEGFVQRIHELLLKKEQVLGDILELKDGRIFERDFVPVFMDEVYKGHLWNYTDITQRQRTQNALIESETKNRLIMNAAMDAIITIDRNGAITFWNPQAEKIFGWTEAEALNQPLVNLIVPSTHRDRHNKGMFNYKKTGEGSVLRQIMEFPALHKSGTEFPIEISVTPIHFDGETFFCAFIRDISKRKKVEQALATSEQKYRSIIANMNLGLLEVDKDDNVQFCNQSFEQISGYTLAEMHGKPAGQLFMDDDHLRILKEKNQLRMDGVYDSYEMSVRNKSGAQRWWLISGAPNYDEKGANKGSIGIHLDITEEKRLKHELEIALQKAQEASKAKESFLANMSHEIRTPLNAIIGMIRELGREELTPKQNSYLSHSETSAKHLLSIVNNILDMSRIEAGELILEKKEFSLSAVINMAHSILFVKAREKGLMLRFHNTPEIKTALIGDGGRIRQILINLIGNAIKFTEKGTVQLDVTVVEDNDIFQKIHFNIMDTGIGMSKEYLKTVFEKFSQEESNSTKKYEGTGLGMSITKEMISLMGGVLDIQSEKGKGTTIAFELIFPVGDPAKIVTKQEVNIDQSLAGLRCLLVEDNEMNRLIATQSLQHFGCIVTNATDGKKAIDIFQQHSFDFILMDIQMPVMDGIETTQYIRNVLHAKIPIIALTANAFKSEIDRYLAIGMNDYITKPYEEYHLFSTIANTLNIKTLNISSDHFDENELDENPLYDLSKLQDLGRGDQSFVRKMVQIFIEHTPISIQEMKQAAQAKNYSTIGKLAHRLKPSIGNMGIQKLVNIMRELEAEAKIEHANNTKINHLIHQAESVVVNVIEQLKRFD